MVIIFFVSGLLFGSIFSWLLSGMPVSDGYDLLALFAVAFAAFDLGSIGLNAPSAQRIFSAILFILIFACTYLSIIFSPILLGMSFMFLTVGKAVNWYTARAVELKKKLFAVATGFHLLLTIFIFTLYT